MSNTSAKVPAYSLYAHCPYPNMGYDAAKVKIFSAMKEMVNFPITMKWPIVL